MVFLYLASEYNAETLRGRPKNLLLILEEEFSVVNSMYDRGAEICIGIAEMRRGRYEINLSLRKINGATL